ncbi:hypothetical protein NADFUDRAFT_49094 [Nadsonia fulvescens var. elongata DSM 6958]|uniref:Ubiquitin-like domain-containing protein n=1 Tax=Nadsonia fulvescens var. elongata DSM 6958 TaxID=857566 RepID=A0A1E3PT66_9ASCO|nr:hypothetical protein NADFUDRAFT_49094 [Nadsonia fulvescens var. elongata DSM 6958]
MSEAAENVKPEGTGSTPVDVHINVKVTDNDSEVFFKIKPTTPLRKLTDSFCSRVGKDKSQLRFLYEGEAINDTDTAGDLGIQSGDIIEAHQEQLGGR